MQKIKRLEKVDKKGTWQQFGKPKFRNELDDEEMSYRDHNH